jgi:hypothetical protein
VPAPRLTADLVDQLRAVRHAYGPAATRDKRALLRACAGRRITSASVLGKYHDVLLFLIAYADGSRLREAAERELERVRELLAERPDIAGRLESSGIAGTGLETQFSLDLMEWLGRRYPSDAELVWDGDSLGPEMDGFLASCLPPVESDGFFGRRMNVKHWLDAGRGGADTTDLAWLAARLRCLPCQGAVLDQLVGSLDLSVRLELRDPTASRTGNRLDDPRRFDHDGLKRTFSLPRLIGRAPPAPMRLSSKERIGLIDVARAMLAARIRETDPVTYANPREVTRWRLDRGIDIVVTGMRPERRLPIESFFGLMIAKNNVPVAYGGGWVFLDRAEIGINVFDEFRGGESAYLFGQAMRVYRHHFGVRRFVVDPYQIGEDNPEAIRSGAFWFYYRFGFRPADAAMRDTAAEEWVRVAADRAHRTPAALLRRFAGSPMQLDTRSRGSAGVPTPDLPAIACGVTGTIAPRFGHDREAAAAWARRKVRRALDVRPDKTWPPDERAAFDRLSVLVAAIDDLDEWPAGAKKSLVRLMRAKGGPRERDYVRAMQRHTCFRAALQALEERGQSAIADRRGRA